MSKWMAWYRAGDLTAPPCVESAESVKSPPKGDLDPVFGAFGTFGTGTVTEDRSFDRVRDAEGLAALADEGAYSENVVDLATIREARALAGVTRQPLECRGDEQRFGCERCVRRRP